MDKKQLVDKIISEKVNETIEDTNLQELAKFAQDIINQSNVTLNQDQFQLVVNLMAITSKFTAKHAVVATINTINEMQSTDISHLD